MISSLLHEKEIYLQWYGNRFSTCHQQIFPPTFQQKAKKKRERRKNTTQVVDMDKNILANDNTMDWFGFLGAIVALWSLIL